MPRRPGEDNFYAAAEVSADGWNWSTAATANTYTQKTWEANYSDNGGRNHPYQYEGGTYATAPGKTATSSYLWDSLDHAGGVLPQLRLLALRHRTGRSAGSWTSSPIRGSGSPPRSSSSRTTRKPAPIMWTRTAPRPYTARIPSQSLTETNSATAPMAAQSAGMNLDEGDLANDQQLNLAIWQSVKATAVPMPAGKHAAPDTGPDH